NNICTSTAGVGAGVGNFNGVLTITNSTISWNKNYNINGGCPGGGVGSSGGTTVINNSTICYNQAASGAGIGITLNQTDETGNAIFNMTNSTISENSAGFNGGAIRIYLNGTPINNIISNVNSCTIYKNHSDGDFGGILLSSQTDFNIKNTILAGNTAGPTFISNDLKGFNNNDTITSGDYNLIQTNINVTINGSTANNIYNQAANCLTLADNNTTNGTQTCRTQSGSPAIDKIPGRNGAPLQDQRGAFRNDSCDIGAYEWWTDDGALPVELTSFTAQLKNDKVTLNWVTATELNNYGFEIERRVGSIQSAVGNPIGTGFEKIGFVQGNGNSNSHKIYSFIDDNLFGGSKFQYRLKQIDFDGQYEYSDVVEVRILPDKYSLSQNYPNPFNPSTKIVYSISEKSNVSIKIYDLLGNEVLELFAGEKEPGNYEVEFNAQDLSNGVYFYRMQAGKFVQTRKMILMK
ncbi:MAG: T9SS type A sorting domain-containing protein, partial [Ignavibacteriota bacterium]